MGNLHTKTEERNKLSLHTSRDGQAFTSQFSLSHFVGNLSGRSFLSVTSNHSVNSTSRPWSRVSRRRWHDSTLNNPLEACKTAWPVAHKESIFLPEFPITTDLLKKDFKVVQTIAKGAFGEVFKVRKVSENKEYALKVLSKSQLVHDRAVCQVKEEAKIQSVVGHHQFIAGAVSRWQTKKRLYIVSEYIPGGELLVLLDQWRKLPEDIVKVFVAEIAFAIDFLHNAGIIYRDLKPENILLDSDYHIRLIDFGLSKWLCIGSRTTTLCGTLKYMAPEILQRDAYGHAVDWWSLGVITCRMLTGEFPEPAVHFEDKKDKDVEENNSYDVKPTPIPGALPNAELSKAARGLLIKLLEVNPQYRVKSLRQLQQTAFFMGFNFDDIKIKKNSPKTMLQQYGEQNAFPEIFEDVPFTNFNQNLHITE
ncbi:serine/threonine-protein kinase S6KL isoform X1 [Pieris rapae]|uniref:serine/threonine-protein kinase S6KL isoform X1 n=1 Tax=Pieris rapae TaxID=64459 RepID=UPI001E27C431|nr:serine/threonine-protein kinase S6KL isoform X1 [Pieris rapae]